MVNQTQQIKQMFGGFEREGDLVNRTITRWSSYFDTYRRRLHSTWDMLDDIVDNTLETVKG
jgi:hypothetical protein